MADVTQVGKLLHGQENTISADAGYTGVEKRAEHADRKVIWQIAARRGSYKKHRENSFLYQTLRQIERAKARIRAKVEHPFHVV